MTATTTPVPTQPSRRSLGEWWNSLDRVRQWAILIPLVVLLYALPVLNPPLITTQPGYDFPIAMFEVARYVLIAIGLNVVVGQAGLLDLGYVGFFAVGAYVAALFTSPDSALTKLPFLVVLPLAMVITMVFGIILGTPTLRLRGDYLAIVTLGFGEIVRLLADNLEPLRGNRGFENVGHPPGTHADGTPIFTNTDGTPWYWLTISIVIVMLVLVGNLERSRVGRSWLAIRDDEDAAALMGVNTYKFKIWAFVIGAAIGGLSGALYAGQLAFVNNQRFDIVTSVLFLAAVILGGAGNKVGVILGAVVVAYIPLRFLDIAEYRFLIFGFALIVLMIFRPQGLLGARQRLLTYGREAYQRLLGRGEQISKDTSVAADRNRGVMADHDNGPEVAAKGGLVTELAQMTEAELAQHEAEVAETVVTDREVAVEVGETLLEIDNITVRFGGLTALDSVSFGIRRGEILGLIGPNGAGKTTCFNAMTGVYLPTSGQVRLEGKPLGRLSRHNITRLGIARTFQNIRLFGEMTALENVIAGTDARHKTSVLGALIRSPRHYKEEKAAIERAIALLDFVGIADRAADKARNLPYGYQRRLEIARALATQPKLLCLDEPAAGFNPAEKDELMGLIRTIRDDGYTVLLIEHDMKLVMGVTDRIVVLEFGRKIAEGLPAEIRENPAVIAAYLGVPDDDLA